MRTSLLILLSVVVNYCSAWWSDFGVPENEQSAPYKVWYGDQDLVCVMTANGLKDVNNLPSPNHRILYYRGTVYEWGIGPSKLSKLITNLPINTMRAAYGSQPSATSCQVFRWIPKGTSSKSLEEANNFANNYKRTVGSYRILTNNCFRFAKSLCIELTGSRRGCE